MNATFAIKGGAELDSLLKQLPSNVARRVAGNALRAGARVIASEAKARVAKKTGELAKNIKVKTEKVTRSDQRLVSVGVGGKEGPLAHLVEFGSAPHTILPEKGSKLAFYVNGKLVVVEKVSHPGTAPKPFLRPAADTKASEAVDKIATTLGVGIEKEAAKLAGI